VAGFWDLPAWVRSLLATITAIAVMVLGLTVGFEFETGQRLNEAMMKNQEQHIEMRHRVSLLETETCTTWQQDDIERRHMQGLSHALKRPRPSWCRMAK
jgi:hypothetical protein